jgi:cytochrome c oxidase subunit 2
MVLEEAGEHEQAAAEPEADADTADSDAEPQAGGDMTDAELMSQGESVYNAHCVACHQANGEGTPPVFPALKGGPVTTGPVAGHLDIVLNGKAGTSMQPFARLSDAEIAAVVTYERNAWGNDTGDVVQPSDVRAAR